MMDEGVYIVMRDVPIRQIDFMVKLVENINASGIVVNAFDIMRGAFEVFKNHTRSSDYMIQFMKKPLTTISHVCDCKAYM